MSIEFLYDESFKNKEELNKIIKEVKNRDELEQLVKEMQKQRYSISRTIFLKKFILAAIKAEQMKEGVKEEVRYREPVKVIKEKPKIEKEKIEEEIEIEAPKPEEKEKPLTGAPIPVREGHLQIEYDLDNIDLEAPEP